MNIIWIGKVQALIDECKEEIEMFERPTAQNSKKILDILETIWDKWTLSANNPPMEYQKYEFCRAVKCQAIRDIGRNGYHAYKCDTNGALCEYSAHKFHQWLNRNGYKIIKEG